MSEINDEKKNISFLEGARSLQVRSLLHKLLNITEVQDIARILNLPGGHFQEITGGQGPVNCLFSTFQHFLSLLIFAKRHVH